MRMRALALVAAAVAGAAALAGCGVQVSSGPAATPSLRPSAATASPLLSPWSSPPLPVAPLATPSPIASDTAAAARKAAAAAEVEVALPQFDDYASRTFAQSQVPGAAVAVIAGDRAVYVRCFGVRKVGQPDVVDMDTVFQVGSISQSFTATMLAGLVGDGTIAWDDPVERYYPGFTLWDPWVSRHVTVRDLLAQRSGLPAYAGDELLAFGYGRAQILHRLRYLRPAAGFRAAFADQNAGPTAAAVAAERAAGAPWTRLVRRRVLEPLDMRGTCLTYSQFLGAPDRTVPHVPIDGRMQPQTPTNGDAFAPAGGVSAGVADLVPYVRMQLNDGALAGVRVAPAGALRQTYVPTTSIGAGPDGPEAGALGWRTSSYDGRLVVAQTGDIPRGVSSLVSMMPDDGVAVVVLTNAFPEGHALAAALANTLYDLALKGSPQADWLPIETQRLQQEIAGLTAGPAKHLPDEPPADAAAPRPAAAYTGAYANAYYGRIVVSHAPGGLRVKLGRGATIDCHAWDGDTWRQVDTGTAVTFTVRGGRAVSVKLGSLAFAGRDGTFRRAGK